MSVYTDLLQADWVKYFKEMIDAGQIQFSEDGKFEAIRRITADSPWVITDATYEIPELENCSVYQYMFARRIGFIHTDCHSCYKVTLEPHTVSDLFWLEELQRELCLPSKCGIEKRDYVDRIYGGYFYCRSIEEGQEKYQLVMDCMKIADKDFPVSLKRGCTEFETSYGPSNEWEIKEGQEEIEKLFKDIYIERKGSPIQPDYLKAHIKLKWLQWAAENFDETYKEFTDGEVLIPRNDTKTYHKEAVNV